MPFACWPTLIQDDTGYTTLKKEQAEKYALEEGMTTYRDETTDARP